MYKPGKFIKLKGVNKEEYVIRVDDIIRAAISNDEYLNTDSANHHENRNSYFVNTNNELGVVGYIITKESYDYVKNILGVGDDENA